MENKLEQLTQKLYNEGLEKGRKESQDMVNLAKEQSAKIIADAKAQAAKIVEDANQKAAETTKNTANDIRMASQQTLSALRSQIETMVVSSVVNDKVSAAWADSTFVKNLIVDAVKSWNVAGGGAVKVVVPENMVADVQAAVAAHFKDGVDVAFDGKTRIPFRIAPRDGGYYVSFTDADFKALICDSLRQRVSTMLFEK